MPIFMDRHDMPEGMTKRDVEEAHHADMKAQNKHDVNFLTYWYDPTDGCVFCVAEAPDSDSIKNVHGEAHGNIPHNIVEVDLSNVEAFMGEIKDTEEENGDIVQGQNSVRCIMFTDLEDSTEMLSIFGDGEAIRLLGIHDNLVRESVKKNNGREVKHTGDGFLISFVKVEDAVQASIDIQNAFKTYNIDSKDRPLNVRIGLNAGQPIEREGDLFGMVVNLASRFCDHAKPKQILATGIVFHLLEKTPELGSRFNEMGKSYFKGFAHATQVYEIDW